MESKVGSSKIGPLSCKEYYKTWFCANYSALVSEFIAYMAAVGLLCSFVLGLVAYAISEAYGWSVIIMNIECNGFAKACDQFAGLWLFFDGVFSVVLTLVLVYAVVKIAIWQDWRKWSKVHPFSPKQCYDIEYFDNDTRDLT